MIDLHSHIIPGIDDGADSLDTSLKMLKIAEADGIQDIILTPHFIAGSIDNSKERIEACVKELECQRKSNHIKINLYPGSEVFIDPSLPILLDEGYICTLNKSDYLLVEFPMMSIPGYAREIIYQLKLKGFTPIIAHPERNKRLIEEPNLLYEYIQAGALTQVNATSIKGIFGNKVKDTAYTFLRHGMVHFVSTDAHTCRGRSPKMAGVYELISKEFGENISRKLFSENGRLVLKNHTVDPGTPIEVKKSSTYIIPMLKKICTQIIRNHA